MNEWPLDSEGFPHRSAARSVVYNSRGEILLILGHDIDDPGYRWWFTPGGGLEGNESPREGAVRELAEETGLQVEVERLVGPVLDRRSTFRFVRRTRKQDELFFLLSVTRDEEAEIERGIGRKWTDLERKLLDEVRWWDLADLAREENAGNLVFPVGLATRATKWLTGWDGKTELLIE